MATRHKKIFLTAIIKFCFCFITHCQLTQTIRGKVVDQLLQKSLAGATVSLNGLSKSTVTDHDGSFRITNVPVGSHQIQVSFTGFKEVTRENIVLNTGKEVVLIIPLEADVEMQPEVIVRAKSRKYKPINEMSVVSARAFT